MKSHLSPIIFACAFITHVVATVRPDDTSFSLIDVSDAKSDGPTPSVVPLWTGEEKSNEAAIDTIHPTHQTSSNLLKRLSKSQAEEELKVDTEYSPWFGDVYDGDLTEELLANNTYEVDEKIQAWYEPQRKWFPAYYRGPDEGGRDNMFAVEYFDVPNKTLGTTRIRKDGNGWILAPRFRMNEIFFKAKFVERKNGLLGVSALSADRDNHGKGAYVEVVTSEDAKKQGVARGQQIIKVADIDVANMDHQEILQRVQSQKLPFHMTFRKPHGENDTFEKSKMLKLLEAEYENMSKFESAPGTKGAYGELWQGIHRDESKTPVCLKILYKNSRKFCPNLVSQEISILYKVQEGKHENMIKFYGIHEDPHFVVIVMEMVQGNNLFQHITTRKDRDDEKCRDFTRQILKCVKYIQALHIVHLDIKPQNFMVATCGDRHIIKMIDFGFSLDMGTSTEVKCSMRRGTRTYVSPESNCKEQTGKYKYTHMTDVWAAAAAIFELWTCTNSLAILGIDNEEQTSIVLKKYNTPSFITTPIARILEDDKNGWFRTIPRDVKILLKRILAVEDYRSQWPSFLEEFMEKGDSIGDVSDPRSPHNETFDVSDSRDEKD